MDKIAAGTGATSSCRLRLILTYERLEGRGDGSESASEGRDGEERRGEERRASSLV